MTKGNTSMLVARLESVGLVARTPAGAAYSLRLTPDGEAMVARLRPRHAAFLAECFGELSDAELSELGRLFDVLERRAP